MRTCVPRCKSRAHQCNQCKKLYLNHVVYLVTQLYTDHRGFSNHHIHLVLIYITESHLEGWNEGCSFADLSLSVLCSSWTQQCGSVRAGVVGHTGCRAARWPWVTTNSWMPALLNVQESWRLATIQRCPQAEPADLTLTLSGDKCLCLCVRVQQ